MGTLQTNPPTIPNTEVDSWQPLVERDAMSYYGLNKVSLTNWDETTTIPQIAQGSMIDIDGSLAFFAADEVIIGSPADGTVYVYFLVSGSTVTPEFTNTAPEWYADKGGWYDATGNRYSGHLMTKAGAVYSDKRRWRDESDGEYIALSANRGATVPTLDSTNMNTVNINTVTVNADDPQNWTGTFSSHPMSLNNTWVLPAGGYMFAVEESLRLQILSGGIWYPTSAAAAPYSLAGFVVSDGVNYRILADANARDVYHRKIW